MVSSPAIEPGLVDAAALRALLGGLIDYAGLFPPAGLEMRPAVEEFARRRRGDDGWILARFVVPLSRLDELAEAAGDLFDHGGAAPWPLSVLAGQASDADLAAERATLDAWNAAHGGRAKVEMIESKARTVDEIRARASAFAGFETYLEIPHDEDPAVLLEAIAASGAKAKIRTGGVREDLIPSAAEVARFVVAAARAGAAFKATAGLHHPLRGEYPLTYAPDSPSATLHGFLNVFLASALARLDARHGGEIDAAAVEALLEQRDPDVLRELLAARLDAASLGDARQGFAVSYGSCSFAEPVDDLRALGWLAPNP